MREKATCAVFDIGVGTWESSMAERQGAKEGTERQGHGRDVYLSGRARRLHTPSRPPSPPAQGFFVGDAISPLQTEPEADTSDFVIYLFVYSLKDAKKNYF